MAATARSKKEPRPSDQFEWPTDLPYDDGEPMDTPWHRDQMNLLIDVIEAHWAGRKDFYCGGDMFLYFNAQFAKNKDFRGPDFYLVKGVDHDRERKYWAAWEEAVPFPDVIVELTSESTKAVDLGIKKDVYEKTFKTPEYFCYDPDERKLLGWRLVGRAYQPIKLEKSGRMWSEELGLWLGPWEGKFQNKANRWIRFFTKAGRLVPTHAEAEAADAARQRARADQEGARADQEATARMAAEAEVARLKQELANARRRNGK